MHLAHVAAAQHLAARDTARLFATTSDEIAEAERRAVRRLERLTAAASPAPRHPLTERGRHAAPPRPARA
ncbi:hypothetical protein [Agromyces aerolatus]|uniref:hypothetical protein n=1 Tax=Agromyces sp. LY-1074 TaxID=3074080 RepID=UPI00285B97F0|nr:MULTISPECIES: hypothetical protein [unclassified Agromyces]MDR5698896.1 hypothetical protein [Agromyces sp. LY-1074]MDR5705326.1 hypothetical protein [Agromyces sp. LY-1358]